MTVITLSETLRNPTFNDIIANCTQVSESGPFGFLIIKNIFYFFKKILIDYSIDFIFITMFLTLFFFSFENVSPLKLF